RLRLRAHGGGRDDHPGPGLDRGRGAPGHAHALPARARRGRRGRGGALPGRGVGVGGASVARLRAAAGGCGRGSGREPGNDSGQRGGAAMTYVLVSSGVMLALAAVLLVVRMTVGPTILDRSMALDVLTSVMVSAVALKTIQDDESWSLP